MKPQSDLQDKKSARLSCVFSPEKRESLVLLLLRLVAHGSFKQIDSKMILYQPNYVQYLGQILHIKYSKTCH